jgi:hypothetical protein
MSAPKDGGQAFPSESWHGMTLRDFFAAAVAAGRHANPHLNQEASAEDMATACGMTLRDFFAAAVAAGIHANPHLNQAASAEEMASACYQLADAMIAKRNMEAAK